MRFKFATLLALTLFTSAARADFVYITSINGNPDFNRNAPYDARPGEVLGLTADLFVVDGSGGGYPQERPFGEFAWSVGPEGSTDSTGFESTENGFYYRVPYGFENVVIQVRSLTRPDAQVDYLVIHNPDYVAPTDPGNYYPAPYYPDPTPGYNPQPYPFYPRPIVRPIPHPRYYPRPMPRPFPGGSYYPAPRPFPGGGGGGYIPAPPRPFPGGHPGPVGPGPRPFPGGGGYNPGPRPFPGGHPGPVGPGPRPFPGGGGGGSFPAPAPRPMPGGGGGGYNPGPRPFPGGGGGGSGPGPGPRPGGGGRPRPELVSTL